MRTWHVLEIQVTANGCEFLKRTSVGTPTTMLSLSETVLCDSLLLDSEYSESSRDLRIQSEIPNCNCHTRLSMS